MSIVKKVNEVEHLFVKLDAEINSFQASSTLHCLPGCGRCCTHNEIEASPLEFLPWAYHLFVNGDAQDMLEELAAHPSSVCHVYSPVGSLEAGKGSCGNYPYRGLICRLFGFGATTDKYGKLRLAVCSTIKKDQALAYHNAETMITEGLSVPVFTEYYMRLSQIDFLLGRMIVPINEALKLAIEEVLHYYSYRSLEDEIVGVA